MRLGILGPLDVADDGGSRLPLAGRRQRSVLAILLLHPNEVVSSDRLAEVLWSGRPPASAAASLQAHISRLRRALGEDGRITTTSGGYLVQVGPGELDAERFERLVEEGSAALATGERELASAKFREALALWRGPPLSDFQYDSFAQAEIARLSELQVRAAEQRIEAELELGHEASVIGDLEQLVREHPYRERLRGQLMLALYRTGRQAEALQAYHDAREVLVGELGIEPSTELREFHQAILGHHASLSAPAAAAPSGEARHLPAAATPFLGRARELAEVTALLRRHVGRLVTLTGAGGSGKTRLALQVAATCGALVLDNLEQLTPGVGLLSELLTGCPGVRPLVTSREPLRLAGEQQYEVPVLDPGDAIELFTARARTVAPNLVLERDQVGAVCERLDRLPLAIELAAARTKVLSPPEILNRLELRLPVLGCGPRDAPRRQRTLQATIDWSYELLTDKQQQLFARLSVLAGGCTLEAAEAVCDADLDTLEDLIDRSLVRSSGGRYWMLQPPRVRARQARAVRRGRRHPAQARAMVPRIREASRGTPAIP